MRSASDNIIYTESLSLAEIPREHKIAIFEAVCELVLSPASFAIVIWTLVHYGASSSPGEAITRYRCRVGEDEGINGDPDYYSLGTRLGTYKQSFAAVIKYLFLADERQSLLTGHLLFSISVRSHIF